MRNLLLVLLLLVAPAFAADSDATNSQAGAVALAFINGYAKATFARDWNPQKWVATSPLVTDNFKRTLKKMIADGFRKDPSSASVRILSLTVRTVRNALLSNR